MAVLLLLDLVDEMFGDGPHTLLIQHDLFGECVDGVVLNAEDVMAILPMNESHSVKSTYTAFMVLLET